LVNSVKGYATHESSAFEKVTQARAAAMGAKTAGEHSKTEAMLGQAITGLFGIAEAYPDLKANQNFLALQNELSDTENKIQANIPKIIPVIPSPMSGTSDGNSKPLDKSGVLSNLILSVILPRSSLSLIPL
jgi:hypothetical protein